MNPLLFILCLLLATFAFAQRQLSDGVLTDTRDGKKYKVVKIGNQTWMAENLNYDASGSKCHRNEPANCAKYGRLYNWETAKKACPSGWHLPVNDEWGVLVSAVGGEEVAGKKLKSKSGWNENGGGTDEFGFSALPGGNGYSVDGLFYDAGDIGYWWSDSEYSNRSVHVRRMNYNDEDANWNTLDKLDLFSVRCLQDDKAFREKAEREAKEKAEIEASKTAVQQNSFTDSRDKKTYKIVKIGTRTWMAENLNYEAKGSKCYENNSANCAKYGRLYNWETAMKVCPSGWHLPSNDEWGVLVSAIGGEIIAGKKLKSKSGWNENGGGTDEFGFSALPGGNGRSSGRFNEVGAIGYWWSASERDSSYASYRDMYYDYDYARWANHVKSNLLSVRCLQDVRQ